MVRSTFLFLCLIYPVATTAERWHWAQQLPIDSQLPAIEILDSKGETRQINELYGDKGLLLFLNRSTVW